jgi:hypothetical protein
MRALFAMLAVLCITACEPQAEKACYPAVKLKAFWMDKDGCQPAQEYAVCADPTADAGFVVKKVAQ